MIKEKGNPYYGLDEITDPSADPLADVTLINIYDRSIARSERCGYCWYGDSFFEAREQWQFFSGGRFRTAEELKQDVYKRQMWTFSSTANLYLRCREKNLYSEEAPTSDSLMCRKALVPIRSLKFDLRIYNRMEEKRYE